MPAWLKIFLDTGEFLAFGLYFLLLGSLARQYGTDAERQGGESLSKLLRGAVAGWGATKLGGGCLTTILLFMLLWWGLGHFQIFQ